VVAAAGALDEVAYIAVWIRQAAGETFGIGIA
jgi:hypothetical protein